MANPPLFEDMILRERPDELKQALNRYVKESIIGEEVSGNSKHGDSYAFNFRTIVANYFDEGECESRGDLLDIANLFSGSSIEKAEIFQRLVLSVVGFTGNVVEWLLVSLDHRNFQSDQPKNQVLEVLRHYSPIWRLTRKVERGFELDSVEFTPGIEVILLIQKAHKSRRFGESVDEFDPSRWDKDPRMEASLLSFGLGRRTCPAKAPAIAFLVELAQHVSSRYQISFMRNLLSFPRYGTFLACPSGRIVAIERS